MGAELKHEAVLRLPLPGAKIAEAVLRALRPEAERPPTGRFSASVALEGSTLMICIRARDTSSLRAAINSFMSWARAVVSVCRSLSPRRHI